MNEKSSDATSAFSDIKSIKPEICESSGKRYRVINCREEFTLPLSMQRSPALPEVKINEDAPTVASDTSHLVEGLASSTSVDSYGTEMSREALFKMRDQFERGVPLLPRHNNGLAGGVEWDQVIGRTIRADVERSDVAQAAEGGELQYVLRVTSSLYDDDDTSKKLLNRLAAGQSIGQSIGGWFMRVRVISNDEDEIERVIVDDVELDHLAITRAPANPDSSGLYALLSRLDAGLSNTVSASDKSDRHVVSVTDNNETVTVVYKKLDSEDNDNDEEYENNILSTDNKSLQVREATGFSDLPLAPENDQWEWNSESQNEILGPDGDDWDTYKKAHLWFDPKDDETKSGYKLPIARMYGPELRVVFRAVSAAMAALNGARGGVDLPDEDREDVYNHLVRYYTEFDKDPPELKSKSEADELSNVIEFVESSNFENQSSVKEESDLSLEVSPPESCNKTQGNQVELASVDAQRSAIPANPVINSHEVNEMTDSDFDKIQTLLSASVGGLAERVKDLEAKLSAPAPVEPAPIPVDDMVNEKLERRLAQAESMLAKIAENPVRRGLANTASLRAGPGATTELDGMISRARDGGACPSLCAIMERHKDVLAEENGVSKVTSSQLRDLLAAGLRAAVNDGLIGNSGLTASWE
jgi:hypothetical protein